MDDVITADEIREIRQAYGLTQKAFATLLGIGSASIARYEQGSQPSKANANLIRAARYPRFMADCLERDGDMLSEQQRRAASQVIYSFIELDSEQGAPLLTKTAGRERLDQSLNKMNEVYELTLRWEILNEQAANIMGEIISIKCSEGFTESAGGVYNALLSRVGAVKRSILETEKAEELDAIAGYLQCAQDMLNRRREAAA